MFEDPYASLSLIAGPAILANASGILLNGATTRYNLAVGHWRETRARLETDTRALADRYEDPTEALVLIRRRVWLQLHVLALLNAAVALFAGAAVLGLAGPLLGRLLAIAGETSMQAMALLAATGLTALLAATGGLFVENASSGALLRLDREHGELELRNTKPG